jgi:hypothetical protein
MDTDVAEKVYSEREEGDIERLMWVIWDDRCPGIRWSEEDRPHYRAAAIAALTSLGIIAA